METAKGLNNRISLLYIVTAVPQTTSAGCLKSMTVHFMYCMTVAIKHEDGGQGSFRFQGFNCLLAAAPPSHSLMEDIMRDG
jgi:hypothetical protein